MATAGRLNRRLDKVEKQAAELGANRAGAFDMYALLYIEKLRSETGEQALYEVLCLPDEPQSAETKQLLRWARREALATIKAAGEATITAAVFEQMYFEWHTRGKSGDLLKWHEAHRDKSLSLSQLTVFTRYTLQSLLRSGYDIWDKI